jgi:hypothetical protein
VLYDKNKKIIERSVIAWSDSNIYADNNPFGIEIER